MPQTDNLIQIKKVYWTWDLLAQSKIKTDPRDLLLSDLLCHFSKNPLHKHILAVGFEKNYVKVRSDLDFDHFCLTCQLFLFWTTPPKKSEQMNHFHFIWQGGRWTSIFKWCNKIHIETARPHFSAVCTSRMKIFL